MNITTTENSELAFDGFSNKCLTLFSTINRDTNINELYHKFIEAWNENPQLCIKILLNFRDIREGKGEKKISFIMLSIIKIQNFKVYEKIIDNIIGVGCWKDLLQITEITPDISNKIEIKKFSDQLLIDKKSNNPSLCAKWAPSEGSHYDNFSKKLCRIMKMNPKEYRKLLSLLRNKIKIIETNLSQQLYNNINFEHIPSKSHIIYKNAFERNCNSKGIVNNSRDIMVDNYKNYLNSLNNKEKKVNIKGLMPHEIIKKLNNNNDNTLLENQWNAIVEDTKKSKLFNNALCIVDVSGSMFSGKPMAVHVAVALGLLISECCEGYFNNKIISFSEYPKLISINKEDKLCNKYQNLLGINWGFNTDINKVFELILDSGKLHNIKKENMPDKLYIFTDMQFDEVIGKSNPFDKTFEHFKKLFNDNNYDLPNIICWNLRSVSAVPFELNDQGVTILSGFSTAILKSVLKENDFKNLTPMSIMKNTIEHYDIPDDLEYREIKYDLNILKKIKI